MNSKSVTGYTSSWSSGAGRSLFARDEAGRGREVAAGAVAAERDAGGIAAELARVRRDPRPRGDAVIERRGELRLRREAVVDRHHDRVDRFAQLPAQVVVGVEAAEDPSAAVEPHHDREVDRVRGPVHPHRDLAGRAGDRAGIHREQRIRRHHSDRAVHLGAHLRRGRVRTEIQAGLLEQRQDRLGTRM